MIVDHLFGASWWAFLAAATSSAELDNLDKVLVVAHIGAMGLYVVGGLWIKTSLARAQRAIPPAQAAIVGAQVGFDFTVISWAAFVAVAATGYLLLGKDGLADPASPYTLFVNRDLLDSGYGWKLLVMIAFWLILVINGLVMTVLLRPRLVRKLDPSDPPEAMDRLQRDLAFAVKGIDVLAWMNLLLAIGAFLAGFAISFDRTILR